MYPIFSLLKGDYNLNPQPNDEDVSWDLSSSRPGVQAPAAVASGVGMCAVGHFLDSVPVAVLPLISLTLNPWRLLGLQLPNKWVLGSICPIVT